MAVKIYKRISYAQVLMEKDAKARFKLLSVQLSCLTMVEFFRILSLASKEEFEGIIKKYKK